MVHRLIDGTRVLIRPIRPDDKALLADGLRRLSAESVFRRFLGVKRAFTSGELRYLTEVDGRDHIAYVAVDADHPDALIAVARCIRLTEGGDTADIAIVVGDPWQHLGLGGVLLRVLGERARREGIGRFSVVMLAENQPARRLLRAISVDVEELGIEDGVRTVAGAFARA